MLRIVSSGAWEALVGFFDGRAELFVGKDRVGRDARALDDRLSAYLPGNTFNQLAFRPGCGHDRLHGFPHGRRSFATGQLKMIGFELSQVSEARPGVLGIPANSCTDFHRTNDLELD